MSISVNPKDLVDDANKLVTVEFLQERLCKWLPGALEMIGEHLGRKPEEVLDRARRGLLRAGDLPTRELLDALGLTGALEEWLMKPIEEQDDDVD